MKNELMGRFQHVGSPILNQIARILQIVQA
jgi:hypothetical protein